MNIQMHEIGNMRFPNSWKSILSVMTSRVITLCCNIVSNAFFFVVTEQTNILRTHMKTHSDQKNFSCDLCETSFRTKGSLIRHNRRHTGTEARFKECFCLEFIVL